VASGQWSVARFVPQLPTIAAVWVATPGSFKAFADILDCQRARRQQGDLLPLAETLSLTN